VGCIRTHKGRSALIRGYNYHASVTFFYVILNIYFTIKTNDGKGGLLVKIVFASTPGQEEEISELVQYIYSNVFPLYFADEEIREFERLGILNTCYNHYEDFSTLKDAFQVMASLQTVISVLELPVLDYEYTSLFNKNAENLERFGLSFPFNLEQFIEAKNMKKCIFSVYPKAANEMLI
jgi:hypothetical protein